MFSIKSTFTAAASGTGFDIFWMLVLAIAILDDSDRRAKQQRDRKPAPPKPRCPTP
jgi:hypothetical protein